MRVREIEIPSGIMQNRLFNQNNHSIENVERRQLLEDAVKKADLNVTERYALNKRFFPDGGGFKLFPENTLVHRYNFFYNAKNADNDTFIKEVKSLKVPEHVCRVQTRFFRSSKNSFQANLELALKKLKKVLKNF